MAIQQIQYDDKEAINIDSAVPDKNKCKADDLNEIKSVVNNNSYETPKVSSQVDTDYKVNVLTTKNLFDKNTITNDEYIADNGTTQTLSNVFHSDYIPVQPNTKYAISGKNNHWTVTALYDINKNFISRINEGSYITTTASTYYIITMGSPADINTIQIEQGEVATTYEPFIPNTINVNNEKYTDTINVGTDINDKNRVNVLYSENLFNKETTPIFNGYINDDGSITANASNRILYIPIEDNKTYTMQKEVGNSPRFRISLTDDVPTNNLSGYSFVKNDNANTLSITNTTHKYLCVWYWTSASTITEADIKASIIIQEGSSIIVPSINIDGEEIYSKPTLLWTNSNYKTSFGTQDITLNSDNYNALLFLFTPYQPNETNVSVVILKGYSGRIFTSNGSFSVMLGRDIARVDDTTFTIGNGVFNGNTDNSVCVPIAVYKLF